MNPVDAITGAGAALVIAAPASPAELEEVTGQLGVALPGELSAVLAHTTRVDGGPVRPIDFTGRSLDYEDRDLFPAGLPIAGDGAGNFWVLDVTPQERGAAPVFFASHDPPMVVFESRDLGNWLGRVLTAVSSTPTDDATLPPLLARADALAADDELRAFADSLGDRFMFADLRRAEPRTGFEWGRFGARTEVRRHGFARLFALAPPERRPGLLRRLSRPGS